LSIFVIKAGIMKNVLLFLLVSVIVPSLLRAGDSTGFSRIYVSYTPQLNLNKLNIDNNSVEPGVIQAKNTFGQYAAIGFERTTRYGLTIRAGIGISRRVHKISIVKDFHNYDSSTPLNLIVTYPVDITLRSIDPEFMIGYRKRLSHSWAVTAQVGLQQEKFEESVWRNETGLFSYIDNNNTVHGIVAFNYISFMGKNPQPDGPFLADLLFENIYRIKIYIGMERTFKQGLIKCLTAGIESRISYWDDGQDLIVYTSKSLHSDTNVSNYVDRNMSLGLRVGLGLWR
jgi:hypothetical protein